MYSGSNTDLFWSVETEILSQAVSQYRLADINTAEKTVTYEQTTQRQMGVHLRLSHFFVHDDFAALLISAAWRPHIKKRLLGLLRENSQNIKKRATNTVLPGLMADPHSNYYIFFSEMARKDKIQP